MRDVQVGLQMTDVNTQIDAKVLEKWLRSWLGDKHTCGDYWTTPCLACQIYTHLNNKSWEPEHVR